MDYDVVIIGGGVVGLACAAHIPADKSTLLVERHPSFGRETSSRNSEVIHAGIYYPKDSLKAKLCVSGNRSLYQWCHEKGVPHSAIGKFIVAVNDDEEERMEQILARAINNGVEGIHKVTKEFIAQREPNVKAHSALFSPVTGIVDSHKLMESFEKQAIDNNCDFAWNHKVDGIDRKANNYEVHISDIDGNNYEINARYIINSAGLDSDTIAETTGLKSEAFDFRLNYCRGHYYRINSSKKDLVNRLIYPVLPENSPNLGIHLTKELTGELKLGPDAEFLKDRRQNYTVSEELKEKFYTAAVSYLPWLKPDDIYPDQSGIRPKLQKEGGEFRDFIIREESGNDLPGFINLIGIESPGLTSCIEIAKMVTGFIE